MNSPILLPASLLWLVALIPSPSSHAADWPHFLGLNQDLHSAETGLNLNFPVEGPKKLWEVERGRGHAGPVVAAGKVVFIRIYA